MFRSPLIVCSLCLAFTARAHEVEVSLEERVRPLEERLAQVQPAPPPVLTVPDAGAAPVSPSSDYGPQKVPFAFGDFSWAPASNGGPDHPFSFGPFTGELRADVVYHHSF